ncbi:MAG: hypothetical protein JW889_12995 [Verrucomicrobia bacterium]|nr:hypothetical protein [Verrucomicrobiota bacterium]
MRHRHFARPALLAAAFMALALLNAPAWGQDNGTDPPAIIKTKPVFVADVLAQSADPIARQIRDDDIVRIEVVPSGGARAFAYYDSPSLWRDTYGLTRAEDFDNDGSTMRWKLIGGMSESDKRNEFDARGEGGAPFGSLGTGLIELRVWHHVPTRDAVSMTSVPVRVGMQKLYVEIDWLEGSFRKRVERRGETLEISCKPVVDQKFIDAFGQCGLEVVVCDSPETGNTKNVIPAGAVFDKKLKFNRENLADLVPKQFRDETDAKAFNEGNSILARWLIDNGYVNLDPSRPDTVYMIGVQRWSKKRPALGRTMGVVCLLEYEGKRIPMAFVFTRSIAESTAAVNGDQKTQVPFTVAARHTAIHEIAAHCFPNQWNNNRAEDLSDPYWKEWRYLYAGHPHRPAGQDDYYRIYETCVTSTETAMDGAYYTFMHAPRLNDFRWRMANDVTEKTRDVIRDTVVDAQPPRYGYIPGLKTRTTSVADARGARE